MANSPSNTGINRLLHVGNNPFGLLGGGRAVVESGSSSEDEEDAVCLLKSTKIVSSTAQNVFETPKTAPDHVAAAASATTKDDDSMADDNRKPAAKKKSTNRRSNPRQTIISANDDEEEIDMVPPSVDPRRATFHNPYELEDASDEEDNDAEYDSDGWEGPQRGTDPEELEAVEEEALPERSANDKDGMETAVGTTTHNQEVEAAPVHIPIADSVLNS